MADHVYAMVAMETAIFLGGSGQAVGLSRSLCTGLVPGVVAVIRRWLPVTVTTVLPDCMMS